MRVYFVQGGVRALVTEVTANTRYAFSTVVVVPAAAHEGSAGLQAIGVHAGPTSTTLTITRAAPAAQRLPFTGVPVALQIVLASLALLSGAGLVTCGR